jgi:hypothetical protein
VTAERVVGAIELRGTVLRSIFRPRMEDTRRKLLVCGGAGSAGPRFKRLRMRESSDQVVMLDKITRAGHEESFDNFAGESHFRFVRGVIEDPTGTCCSGLPGETSCECQYGRRRSPSR